MYNHYNLKDEIKPEEILMYLRKSRADDPLKSVEEIVANHEKSIDEWCERNLSGLIPPENRYKEIISGGDSIAERPMFQKVLQLIESSKYKAVIVKEVSRFGRPDTMEIGRISKTFRFTETLAIAIEPTRIFNLADKYERDMFEEELKRSAYYLEYSKQIMQAGIQISVKSGNYVASIPPYGYERTTIVVGKDKCPTLKIKEDEADVVRMIFDMYVNQNMGTQVVAKRLNELNLKTRKNRPWTHDSIRTVIENVHYIGKIRWNKRKVKTVVDNGEFRKTRPKNCDDCFIVEGKHEAIISEELFYAAQEKRKKAHRTPVEKELKNPLASLMFCTCGRAVSRRVYKDKVKKTVSEPVYLCNGQGMLCDSGSSRASEIEDFIADVLRKKIKEFKVEANNKNDELLTLHDKQITKLEKALADLDAREEAMWLSQVDTDVDNRMPSNIFKKLMNNLKIEREETKQALENAYKTRPTPIDYQKKIITFQNALDALLDDSVSASEKNFLLKKCIDRIEYHRDKPEKITGKGNGRGWIKSPVYLDVKLLV